MGEEPVEPPTFRYATFTSRFRAVVFDSAIVAFGVILLVMIGDALENVPGSGRIIWLLMLALALLYEPVLVWRASILAQRAIVLVPTGIRLGRAAACSPIAANQRLASELFALGRK